MLLCVKWTYDILPRVQVWWGNMGSGFHCPMAWKRYWEWKITTSPSWYLKSCQKTSSRRRDFTYARQRLRLGKYSAPPVKLPPHTIMQSSQSLQSKWTPTWSFQTVANPRVQPSRFSVNQWPAAQDFLGSHIYFEQHIKILLLWHHCCNISPGLPCIGSRVLFSQVHWWNWSFVLLS